MNKVSESIFDGTEKVIPMANVQHIIKLNDGSCNIITKHTRWDKENDCWDNPIFLDSVEAEQFMKAWTTYRFELEGGKNRFKIPKDK